MVRQTSLVSVRAPKIWVCLVEKALAKFYKSYAALEGGFPVWGMNYLCGADSEVWMKLEDGNWERSFIKWEGGENDQENRKEAENFDETDVRKSDLNSSQKLWKALQAYTEKHFSFCCSISNKQDEMYGLFDGHAYSLLAVRSVKTVKGDKTINMCKVRNPHGESEWTGRWSDQSDMWGKHPNVKKSLKFKPKDDGTFWMSYSDFVTFFDSISVVKRSMPTGGCHKDMLRAKR